MAASLEFNVLSTEELESELESLPGWSKEESKISKTFDCGSFLQAIAFVNRLAVVAERLDHHPDIEINWKRVTISNWTHKKNAVTGADLVLAREIEAVA